MQTKELTQAPAEAPRRPRPRASYPQIPPPGFALPEKRATLFGAMKRSRLERLDAALDSLDGSYLRPSDIARKLAIRRTQANKLIKDGTLPHVRIGRAVRVPAPAFAAYLRSLYDAEAGRGMPRGGSADGLG